MGKKMGTNKNPAKNSSRRSHARKSPQVCSVNVAEARKEIVNALHLHRASPSLSSRESISTPFPSPSYPEMPPSIEPRLHTSSTTHYSSFLLEPLAQPEPTWSTTPPSPLLLPMETQEFEWGDNLSLYTWWVGFLKSLDERHGKTHEQATCPFGEEVKMEECFGELMKRLDGSNHIREASSTDGDDQSWSMHEWLTVPSTSLGGF